MKVFSQLEKAQLENVTSDTASLPKGMITYRTDLNIAKVSNGTSMLALIDESTAQTLSNKTYASPITSGAFTMAQTATPSNPTSGNNKFYFKADGKLYTLDASGNEAQVGSGAGGGVKNLITNGAADDTAASIFVPYADAAGTRPVDGTGGSPTVTTSVTTTNPLDGTKAFLLTKPASNVQGQGWAVPFTVDLAYRAKSLKISADYIINSGTFVPGANGGSLTDGDLIWYIYDVTNSQLIEPSNIKMFSQDTGIADKFEATFQTSATGSSYRLIAHVASTSALAFEIKLDNVTVSPQVYVFGTPVTDWQPFTPTFTGIGTATSVSAYYRRNGENLEVYGRATSGTVAASGFYIYFSVLGVAINTSKIITDGARGQLVGNFVRDTADGTNFAIGALSSVNNAVFVADTLANGGLRDTDGNAVINSSEKFSFQFSVPIQGWSSSVQMSDAADTRIVNFVGFINTAQVIVAGVTNIAWATHKDTHGAWTGTTFIVPVAGDYQVSANNYASATAAATQVYVNGSQYGYLNYNAANVAGSSSTTVYGLKVGDVISIRGLSFTQPLDNNCKIAITRISGPNAIAESEKINAIYKTSAGQVLGVGVVILDFGTKEEDSHNLVTVGGSWKFTAQQNRIYRISGAVRFDTAARRLDLYKNGSFVRTMFEPSAASETEAFNTTIRLNAGDYVDLRANNGSAANLFADDRFNYVCIEGV